jgi:hypothetical protein
MLTRDELFLQPGYHRELIDLLDKACEDESVCRITFSPPGNWGSFVEIGRVLDLSEHWLVLENYKVPPNPSPKGHVLNQSTLYIPTKSIMSIETGNHPDLEMIHELLQTQRDFIRELYGMNPESATGHTPEAWESPDFQASEESALLNNPFFKTLQFISQRVLGR